MKIAYVEICGFRSFGPSPRRLELETGLAIVHGENSQGKTSLAEAVEFLFTGDTSRRQLLGGSPSEFENALRNAHLAETDPVYVEVGIDDGTKVNTLRRELTADYRGAGDCLSRLIFNGAPCAAVTEAGLQLSDPPLAAPVLLEHSLRYAVSAKPGERSDYFKALLEVTDLDTVRNELVALIADRESAPRHPLLESLGALASAKTFQSAVTPLRHNHGADDVNKSLLDACHLAAPPSTQEERVETLGQATVRVRRVLADRQLNVFPLADLSAAAPSPAISHFQTPGQQGTASVEGLISDLESTVSAYSTLASEIDQEAAAVLPLLQAALQVDAVDRADPNHPADCPLCLTPLALTAERVSAIRTEIANRRELGGAATRVNQLVRELRSSVSALVRSSGQSVPAAASWTDQDATRYNSTATRLGADADELPGVLTSIGALAARHGDVVSCVADLDAQFTQFTTATERLEGLDDVIISKTNDALRELLAAAEFVADQHRDTAALATAFSESMQSALEAGTDTAGWATLLELAEQPTAVAGALEQHGRLAATTARLKAAAKQIDAGIQRVLDARLEAMCKEIRRWWSLLRPGELTVFDAITRKGAGKRYLDVTAALAPQHATPGVVRNAIAVFSNSQLNALGLATFLARCTLLGTQLVVLDDPVPGSDREHRSTFAAGVVEALLDDGRQVLITTHDSELARQIHTIHHHRGTDEFKAYLLEPPRDGTQVLRSGDEFERLLLDAESQMHSPLESNRRAAGNYLRIAAERLSKHVIVRGRRTAGDLPAQISDYDNKNLRDLAPLASSYVVDSNEPGQWQMFARLLNDANHDATPPLPAELKQCHSSLRHIKRRHLQQDPDLMKP